MVEQRRRQTADLQRLINPSDLKLNSNQSFILNLIWPKWQHNILAIVSKRMRLRRHWDKLLPHFGRLRQRWCQTTNIDRLSVWRVWSHNIVTDSGTFRNLRSGSFAWSCDRVMSQRFFPYLFSHYCSLLPSHPLHSSAAPPLSGLFLVWSKVWLETTSWRWFEWLWQQLNLVSYDRSGD